jgi:diguanylate cyclase (GGDEF)-like protein
MRKLLNNWLFYGLGRDEYKKSMERVFTKNISGLRRTNGVAAVLIVCFMFFPLIIDKSTTNTMFFVGAGIVSALLYIFVRLRYRKKTFERKIDRSLIYVLIFLSYVNVISFGIYLGVWANPGKTAGAFFGILIGALILFIIPVVFHFCLTFFSMFFFISIVIVVKSPAQWGIDISNTVFCGIISLIFGWHIIMNRLSLASIANRLENERNDYFDQSTIDELTQLKNRRDFMNTFQRYLVTHRCSDKFLCIAILDIDFFKNYNDYYGHPKGDECLCSIGKVLKDLQNSLNIYAARIGGEEFALIWFEKEAVNAQNVAAQVNEMVRGLNIPHEKSAAAPYVTISTGIYVVRCGTLDDVNTLYNLADKALYDAKKNGRDRAVINLSDYLHIELIRETA